MSFHIYIYIFLKQINSIVRSKSKTKSQHIAFPLCHMPGKCRGKRYVVMQIAVTLKHNGAIAVEAIKERVSHQELHV